MRVLISDKYSTKGIDIFKDAKGISVDYKPDIDADGLLKIISRYDALCVRSKTKVTKKVLDAATRLKVVGRAGTGVDNIDVEEATRRGIVVMNTPGGNTITTAEHTIAMIFSLSRRIPSATASLKAGKWEKSKFMGRELFNKKLGIVGMGNIGRVVADRAKGLKMKVLAFDPFLSEEHAVKLGVEKVELDDLLAAADYITVHTPKTPETTGLLDAAAFKKVKKGVKIINCARGGIVDEKALLSAIKSGRVSGAALDVFEVEPPKNNPLLALDNVICTPHLGASTKEAQDNVACAVAEQILAYLFEGRIMNAVNVPSVDAEQMALLAPYLTLAEKLGSFQSQRLQQPPLEIVIEYAGEVTEYDTTPLTTSILKGFMEKIDENVNYVNAPVLTRARGIRIVETTTKRPKDYTNLITVTVKMKREQISVAGAKFTGKDVRIVQIDNFFLEASPTGPLLLIQNKDVPGVVGTVGSVLGRNKINIASLQLGRSGLGKTAMLVVNIDTAINPKVMGNLRRNANILAVSQVLL